MTFNDPPVWVALIAGTFSVGVTVLWLYIAWRAMRAHERLAAAAERMSKESKPIPPVSNISH